MAIKLMATHCNTTLACASTYIYAAAICNRNIEFVCAASGARANRWVDFRTHTTNGARKKFRWRKEYRIYIETYIFREVRTKESSVIDVEQIYNNLGNDSFHFGEYAFDIAITSI